MSTVAFSPEFRLVAACCRPRTFADFDEVVVDAVAPGDWCADAMLALARAHRVEGFVDDGLRRASVVLPPEAAALLSARAAASRVQMLRNAGEEIRLGGLFAAAGIEPVFLKGATLAMLAHGSLALKTSWDIDMLVVPEKIGSARKLLAAAGYRLELPGIYDPALIDTFFRRNKETIWIDSARGTTLELHSALVDVPALLRGVGPQSPVQWVALANGRAVATLAPEPLFAYLCVHGTTHRWERLKWLTDVAALAASGKVNVERAQAFANANGAGRATAAALLLAHRVFDMSLPHAHAHAPRAAYRLGALSLSAIQTNCMPGSTADTTVDDLAARFIARWVQGDSLAARLSVIGELLDFSNTRSRLAVPDWALRLHSLVWLPYRVVTRRWRNRQPRAGNSASNP